MFENLIATLKAEKRTIVFTEGPDPRILEAASRLKKDGLLDSILVGNVDEVKAAAQAGGFDIEGMEIIDPETYPEMDEMVAKMVELRKGKMTEEQCRAALAKGNYFGTMLVKMGKADALLGGATYSTADTVRPALQIIKTKPGNKIVSSLLPFCAATVRTAATSCTRWATARSTSTRARTIWLRSRSRPPRLPRLSASIPRLPCCPTRPRALARATRST